MGQSHPERGRSRVREPELRGGREWFVVGFSPRKQALTIYGVHDGYAETPDPLLDDLGPHTTGKGCLHLKTLSDTDPAVLEQLVRSAWTSAADS